MVHNQKHNHISNLGILYAYNIGGNKMKNPQPLDLKGIIDENGEAWDWNNSTKLNQRGLLKLIKQRIKSAVQGLLTDIDELVDWDATYQDYFISLESVRFLIKKWFPVFKEEK